MAGSALSELISAVSYLSSSGYAPAGGGNASLRDGDNLLVTKTGVSLERLTEKDFVALPLDPASGRKHPDASEASKEWPFHAAAYLARPEINCVLHFHPPCSIALSTRSGDGANTWPVFIPYFIIRVKGLFQVPYNHPGSKELAESVSYAASGGYQVIVLRNHGITALGKSADDALRAVEVTEENARICLLAGKEGFPLPEARCEELREKYWKRDFS